MIINLELRKRLIAFCFSFNRYLETVTQVIFCSQKHAAFCAIRLFDNVFPFPNRCFLRLSSKFYIANNTLGGGLTVAERTQLLIFADPYISINSINHIKNNNYLQEPANVISLE